MCSASKQISDAEAPLSPVWVRTARTLFAQMRMPSSTNQAFSPMPHRSDILRRLRETLQTNPPGDRKTAMLLNEAAAEIERLRMLMRVRDFLDMEDPRGCKDPSTC